MIDFPEIRLLSVERSMVSIYLSCIVLLAVAGCRSEADQKLDSLTSNGITLKRDSTGEVFWIDTAGSNLDEQFWESLSNFEQLEQLSLTGSPVSDADLPQLTALPGLQTLDLSYTQITPAGLAVLSRMECLENLALNGVILNKTSVNTLSQLSRLRSLNLIDTELEAVDCQAIQKALPGCLVAW